LSEEVKHRRTRVNRLEGVRFLDSVEVLLVDVSVVATERRVDLAE
jgi:hypothetical protein